MAKVVNYISDAFTELKSNVTWTPWEEVQRYTIIVTIFTVVLSLAIWGVDTLFADALAGFFNLLNS
ncbi:preprotein translocase subunit SecE [Flavobacterium dauae]|uniref:preprotein translocase subunit SecE n=1 Tax=Flavobacterium dauae TaxID=1563479 RepID=UPI00101B355C|nr:preprotein translocase subunit SecE [Flavobacterium dauae]WLD23465.1 preprotein translocase subunit SecE [Flavobacterium dauae]